MSNYPSLQNMPGVCQGATRSEMEGIYSSQLHPAIEHLLLSYPDLSLNLDSLRPTVHRESVESAFLPKKESGGLALLSSWRQEGIAGLLSNLTGREGPKMLGWLAGSLLALWRLSSSLQTSFYPHLRMSTDEMLSDFALTRDWLNSPIRCIAWHPHARKMAVASRDDSVRVAGEGAAVCPLLRHAGQRDISCLAWKPMAAGELAVGCRGGIILWHVDPASVVSRPSTNCVRQLNRPGHFPVTCLSWHPQGKLLASGSPADPAMLIWSVASEQCTPVKRVSGGGVSLVRWSSDGSKLITATPGRTFRVWNTKNWQPDRWTVGSLKGRVSCAAWSPDSRHLVFAESEESVLYCTHFTSNSESAVPIFDLSTVNADFESDIVGGGLVQDIVWEPAGQRLAVSFRSSPLIAVFATRLGGNVSLSPSGWIRGQEGEHPSTMQFRSEFSEAGGLLTVGWSSGRIQHFPLIYDALDLQSTRVEINSAPQLFSTD